MSSGQEDTLKKLNAVERKMLQNLDGEITADQLSQKTGLQQVEVLRGFQWLQNKGLIDLERNEESLITLGRMGEKYKDRGLPEKRILETLSKSSKSIPLLEAEGFSKDEINITIGILKKKDAIQIGRTSTGLLFNITGDGARMMRERTPEQEFIERKFPVSEDALSKEDLETVNELVKRKDIIRREKRTTYTCALTDLGKKIAEALKESSDAYEEKLTPQMLRDGTWRQKTFRSYDVESRVPDISGGRVHFVNEAIDYIKSIWLELGFEEMQGSIVQSAFWDLDSLFVPQDHPAREMQDTFYLDRESKLPEKILERVKEVHENGADTGSKGWQTKYSKDIAKQTLLRTHTTVISARTISKLKKEDLPKKYFIVGRVYRNEAMDWKHLFEFHHVEGIVVDENASLAQLKGYLKEFFSKMGYSDIRMRPGHFPYTEPSAEIEAYHPVKKQWVEMGGCGIFRPEVTKTLMGFECPVLAWGLGMERIIASYYGITDIRQLYMNDIDQLKSMKEFVR